MGRFGVLDLSNNLFSGVIPNCTKWGFLSVLNLAGNNLSGTVPMSIWSPKYLQMLSLRSNSLSGPLPSSLWNCSTIQHSNIIARDSLTPDFLYVDEALLIWTGQKQKYAKILGLLLVIDLSSNQLTGAVPDELTSLRELVALNLSRNSLTDKFPRNIGQLKQLQMLDLSRNKFSGSIPPGLSQLTFLSTLDLSYDFLSGEIPKGTQLQSFDPSMFSHNHGLCCPPVTPNCSGPVEPPQGQPKRDQDDYDEFMKWFYGGMGLGFAVGSWGFCGAVFFKRSWRHSYFGFLDSLKDWLYLAFVLHKARLERRIRASEVWFG
ncbi:hypothetical protein PTKIN_Ptkin14bG0126800 [Pterospermum kingtungense]